MAGANPAGSAGTAACQRASPNQGLPQKPMLFPWLSVENRLRALPRFLKEERWARVWGLRRLQAGNKKDQKLKHKPTWQPFIFFLGGSTFLKRVCFPIFFVSHIQMYPCVCKCISQQQWSIKYQWSLSCRNSTKIISFYGCQEKKGPWLRMF